ncbi:MAG: hypothetical protein FWC03_08460 [Treponema sp.]|nr:hypothetical protein [Treponema sp.]
MIKLFPGFNTDIESAVACFRPILQRLKIRQGITGFPVFLSLFPHLWNLNKNCIWIITILKANMPVDSMAKFISQYHKKEKVMECYIILSDIFFVNAKVPKEIRKAVIVHEFCHFIALIYASVSTSEDNLQERLKERLSKVIDELTNDQVLKLYQLLNKLRQPYNDFSAFEQTRDDHFRLNCENLDLSYTDLFKNFLLSRQMFIEFLSKEEREKFSNLLSEGKTQEAFDLYMNTARKIAHEKWLPENFAINQSIDILIKYGINAVR